MIPITADSLPIVNINHGTKTGRNQVASTWPTNTPEGVVGIWMASMGYYCILPDYAGFGMSELMHPYFHAKSLTTSIIDAIRAAKQYAQKENHLLKDVLFLTGYSEGGYAALATHKEIEESHSAEFQVTASAPMAGPYNFSELITYIFNQETFPSGAYIGFFLTAYNSIYEWNRLDEIFKDPYSDMMTDLFDGSMTFSEIDNQLPNELNLLLKENFVSGYLNGNEDDIKNAIDENTLLDWTPNAPIRFFHGDADKIVPYFNATSAVSNLKTFATVEIDLITIEGAGHETAGPPCILAMIDWINELQVK
jgi:pimeloyl-ACP methyl ester carboxylesterase